MHVVRMEHAFSDAGRERSAREKQGCTVLMWKNGQRARGFISEAFLALFMPCA